jgi:radical SAM superfamily enzyme YgiQ (UPF0313 family)
MFVTLINPYELGRQPFGLAEPAAWLEQAGFRVDCLDLSLDRLEPEVLGRAGMVAIYLPMHTATRIALEALPRIQQLAPRARLCVYGLYAPVNEQLFRDLGVSTVLGGEFEPGLLSTAERIRAGDGARQIEDVVNLDKVRFLPPNRDGLPELDRYARLNLPDGSERVVGFAEASRGCKHLCRHCPVVPVYHGKFRIVPADVVMADIRDQIASGATHISFGDPDFLNGPTHGLRIARALHEEFPELTYDATIKIEHIVKHEALLPELDSTGCLFIISAVESVDDRVLDRLDKNHTYADFVHALSLVRQTRIALAPTFVAFTPWTTLDGYLELLVRLVELRLVESVPPIQLAIRLLVPQGSYLLRLPEFHEFIGAFDPVLLGYPWQHPDPRVDALQKQIQALVEQSDSDGRPRSEVFASIWRLAHRALGLQPPSLPEGLGHAIPHHSEPWYCCAEPTSQQLVSF